MVHGRKAEARLVAGWEKKYKAPIFTVAQNHVAALKALKAKTIVGATYFPAKLNAVFAKYFTDAGFKVRGMDGIDVPFDKVQELSGEQVYGHIKNNFLKHKGADAIYMLGSGWRTLQSSRCWSRTCRCRWCIRCTARVWEIQKRLHVRAAVAGFGHMLEALP